MTADQIEKSVEQRVKDELTPVDTDSLYRDMLDECYSFESVGGIFKGMQPSRVLEEMDPTAFQCGKNDYEDFLREDYDEFDEQFYKKDEVQNIRSAEILK